MSAKSEANSSDSGQWSAGRMESRRQVLDNQQIARYRLII
jgi:hypothetical protein